MSIVNRLWPRETPTADHDHSLAQRLKDLVGEDALATAENDTADSVRSGQTPPPSTPASEKASVATAGEKSPGPGAAQQNRPSAETQTQISAEGTKVGPEAGKGFFHPKDSNCESQEKGKENGGAIAPERKDNGRQAPQEPISSAPASKGPGEQFMDRFRAAVGRNEGNGEKSAAGGEILPEFQSIQKQFESDFRKRLDGALAEFERRVSSQALVDDVAGQIEQRIRLVSDGIFKEVKSQAWTMHSAVADELRGFREQFAKEIEERVGMLDRAVQNAVQLKERLDETLPKAEEMLRSFPASGQEAAGRVEAATKVFQDQLSVSREEVSREIDAQKQALQELAEGLRQQKQQLQEQMEGFRSEAGSAREALAQASNESLEKLRATAEEINGRTREELSREADARKQALQALAEGLGQQGQQLQAQMEGFRSEAGSAREALVHAGNESLEKLHAMAEEVNGRTREELSREGDGQKQALQALAEGLGQQGQQLQEQIEGFRSEAGSAREALAQAGNESLEKLHATAEEVNGRSRESLENLSAEIERRVLSGGLVEKATEQLGKATQEMVEPALDRIRQARQEADASAETLTSAGERASAQLDAARQQIEARLDSLLGEQLSQLEGSMSGFQRKASEELGSLVERVVAQSTSQLDDRLHGLLQDLFASTGKQINTVARANLTTMHEGLKEAFKGQLTDSTSDATPAAGGE